MVPNLYPPHRCPGKVHAITSSSSGFHTSHMRHGKSCKEKAAAELHHKNYCRPRTCQKSSMANRQHNRNPRALSLASEGYFLNMQTQMETKTEMTWELGLYRGLQIFGGGPHSKLNVMLQGFNFMRPSSVETSGFAYYSWIW